MVNANGDRLSQKQLHRFPSVIWISVPRSGGAEKWSNVKNIFCSILELNGSGEGKSLCFRIRCICAFFSILEHGEQYFCVKMGWVYTGNPYIRGSGTINLLEIKCSDQLLFTLKIYFLNFFYQICDLFKEVKCTKVPLQKEFPGRYVCVCRIDTQCTQRESKHSLQGHCMY